MQHADEIVLRRVKMLVEQYVLARSKKHDFVSTELARKAIRQVIRSPLDKTELDAMLAKAALEQGLSIRFDRIGIPNLSQRWYPRQRSHHDSEREVGQNPKSRVKSARRARSWHPWQP